MELNFSKRATDPEFMDTEPLDPATTASLLGTLERVNRWLGGVRATLAHLQRFSRTWKPGEHIRFIDWGTGGADLPRAVVRWGRAHGFAFEVVGVDNNRAVLDYARQACQDYPEIQLIQSDIETFPAPLHSFDYALSSLFLHHLRDEQIVGLLKRSDELTGRGIIMNDLKRDLRAWMWIWALTRLGQAHSIVQHDGPLSVKRAFTRKELEKLALQAGLPYLEVRLHFGYRFTLAGEKTNLAKISKRAATALNLQPSLNA
jgi:2-polyprenyl-3-methyl-5-hydroxy-6-metoxy-1,4-benzoquinol methylase